MIKLLLFCVMLKGICNSFTNYDLFLMHFFSMFVTFEYTILNVLLSMTIWWLYNGSSIKTTLIGYYKVLNNIIENYESIVGFSKNNTIIKCNLINLKLKIDDVIEKKMKSETYLLSKANELIIKIHPIYNFLFETVKIAKDHTIFILCKVPIFKNMIDFLESYYLFMAFFLDCFDRYNMNEMDNVNDMNYMLDKMDNQTDLDFSHKNNNKNNKLTPSPLSAFQKIEKCDDAIDDAIDVAIIHATIRDFINEKLNETSTSIGSIIQEKSNPQEVNELVNSVKKMEKLMSDVNDTFNKLESDTDSDFDSENTNEKYTEDELSKKNFESLNQDAVTLMKLMYEAVEYKKT